VSNWYKWDSIESFNTWHSAKKLELGLPKLSVDAEGNTVANSVETDAVTLPFEVDATDVRAMVEDNDSEGLIPSTNPLERDEAYSM
jgi:hypothetical protein